ncbi:MAG: hypothetical protein IJ588_06140 [Prevotella sp.]|nr:hypothetical protein [Prevotella sp.]
MKRLLLGLLLAPMLVQAQEVELREVVVKGARVVQQADRQMIYPSRQQRETATSGYSLLNKLSLPHLRIDEVGHSITALETTGGVEVRINDVQATTDDMLSMDMDAVEAVEFIDHPGVRYGEGVAYVINIKVKRPVSGYIVGTDLTQGLTSLNSHGTVYGRANIGKSELGISYGANWQHTWGARSTEQATYQLDDLTTYDIQRRMTHADYRSAGHNVQLTYSLSDSNYVFQARLSGRQPIGSIHQTSDHEYTENGVTSFYRNDTHDKSKSPSLDLYFHRDFRHQSLTANAVGTYIYSRDYSERNEGTPYIYTTTGHTYTLWTEAIYENRLKPFTLSTGIQFLQRYTDNAYAGDAEAHNAMHTSGIYGFGQLSGRLFQRLQYVAGLGLSRRYFSQADHHHDFLLLRPKASLSYPLANRWRLKYDFEISQHVSQIALISDVHIKQNAMETLVGNPDIRPNRVTSHDLRLTYTTPRLMLELQSYYRLNAHCNMEKVIPHPSSLSPYRNVPSTPFLLTQTNQRGCNFFFIQPYAQWTILPDRLTATAYCGLYRFFNYGDDYTHTYTSLNGAAWLQAYLGRWTLTAYGDNGWNFMEGEHRGHQQPYWQLNASLRLNTRLTLSLYVQRPFSTHPKTSTGQLMNRYIHKKHIATDADDGNCLTLNLIWHLSRGRQYRDIERTMNHQDKETGILK